MSNRVVGVLQAPSVGGVTFSRNEAWELLLMLRFVLDPDEDMIGEAFDLETVQAFARTLTEASKLPIGEPP